MPYQIAHVDTPLNIAECQYSTAALQAPTSGDVQHALQFTPITSCIGIFASNTDSTEGIGIHLVLIDSHDNIFGVADVGLVTALLEDYPENVWIVGEIDYWRGSAPDAFNALLAALPDANQNDQGSGIYGAGLNTVDELATYFIAAN